MRKALMIIAAAGLGLGLAGLASADQAEVTVKIVETGNGNEPWAFDPESLVVQRGTTVTWINEAGGFHTVTSTDSNANPGSQKANGKFEGTVPTKDAAYTFTFDAPGTFAYYCSPHSAYMVGTVVVQGAPSDGGGPAPPEATPSLGVLALVLSLLVSAGLAARRGV